jgi:hypothetical protein
VRTKRGPRGGQAWDQGDDQGGDQGGDHYNESLGMIPSGMTPFRMIPS